MASTAARFAAADGGSTMFGAWMLAAKAEPARARDRAMR